ncbi:Uncharacterised protein [Actinobacillus equuli]|nr:Uncharacterised protein [Actinobacillus equuli]
MCDDIAKVALLALPVILYSKESLEFRSLNILFLCIIAYACLTIGRIFVVRLRRNKMGLTLGLAILAILSLAALIFANYAVKHSNSQKAVTSDCYGFLFAKISFN